MPASTVKKPLRIWRWDSVVGGSLAIGATAPGAPTVAPTYGYDAIVVFMNLPTNGGTLTITQYTRNGSSAAGVVNSFALVAAGSISTVIIRTGELVAVTFVNGVAAQTPEILISLT